MNKTIYSIFEDKKIMAVVPSIKAHNPKNLLQKIQRIENGFGNGNAFVFTVYPQAGVPDTGGHEVVHTSYMTILQGGSSVQVPVTYTEFETPVPTPPASVPRPDATVAPQDMASAVQPPAGDVQDVNGYNIPGGAAGAVQVTASAPVPVWVPVFAVLVVLVVMRRRK